MMITLEERSCLISMDENSEFTKPGKINFFCESHEIKFSICGGFLRNIFAFSLIPSEKVLTPS